MAKTDAGKLRDEAARASAKGRHKKALALYIELEALEPGDGQWSRRVGEMCRHLGDEPGAIAAFGRACQRYAGQGFLIKAIATCKIILRIDPQHAEAQAQLVAFNAERGFAIRSREQGAATADERVPPRPANAPGADMHAAIESMALHEQVYGCTERSLGALPSGIFEIPLELDVREAEPIGITSEVKKRDALRQTPLFSALSAASLSRLIDKVALVELPAGQFLFHQGDRGTGLFVIAEGRVAVVADEAVVVELGDGDFFGEVVVVTDEARNAGVQAVTDTELLCIERHCLRELIVEEPAVLPVLLRFLRERLIDNLIRKSPLFAAFRGAERDDLVRRFGFLEVKRGTVLVQEGEVSPALYVTMAGTLSVDRVAQGQRVHLANLSAGDVFGEMSLLANTGAVATVTAQSKCLVLELPGQPFRELIMTHPHVLAFIGDLADQREKTLARVAGGEQQYEELHLDLF